jgi:hypothetical protein
MSVFTCWFLFVLSNFHLSFWMYPCLSSQIYLYNCLPVHLIKCPFVRFFNCLFVRLFECPFVPLVKYPFVRLIIFSFAHLLKCPFASLSYLLYTFPFKCPTVYLIKCPTVLHSKCIFIRLPGEKKNLEMFQNLFCKSKFQLTVKRIIKQLINNNPYWGFF